METLKRLFRGTRKTEGSLSLKGNLKAEHIKQGKKISEILLEPKSYGWDDVDKSKEQVIYDRLGRIEQEITDLKVLLGGWFKSKGE